MQPFKLLAVAVLAYSSNAPMVFAQYDCDKYCFDDCQKYFPQSEFSTCVRANVHCSCHSKASFKNPLIVFALIVVVVFCVTASCIFYRLCKARSNGRHNHSLRTIAYPITATPAAAGGRRSSSTSNGNGRRTSQSQSQRNHGGGGGGIVNPLAPQSSNDVPPEYLAPPPYNECVIDMNVNEKVPL